MGAWGDGGVASGRTVCQQNCPPSNQSFLVHSKTWKRHRLNDSQEAQTIEKLCKPMEEQNPRLTINLSLVYQRFINWAKSASCSWGSWLLTSELMSIFLCKPFSCKDCPGIGPAGTKDAATKGSTSCFSRIALPCSPIVFWPDKKCVRHVKILHLGIILSKNLSNPKHRHTRGNSVRGARQSGQ